MNTLLEIQNITKYYGSGDNVSKALNSVSFAMEQGEFTAVMGASGSGKSTLLNVIATIDRPSSGSILLEGRDIAGMRGMILRIVLTVISTFFISMDFDRIVCFLKRLLPEKAIGPIREKLFQSLKIFLRSYCLIFLITFSELSAGLFILRIPYAVWIGLLVAVVDIMPVLGTGLVLLPWAVIAAFMGNFPLAAGMVLLYILMTAVRNIVEPRLVGCQIGLHPLATLISMFVGMQLFGIIGLFVLPVALSLAVQFLRDGVLPLPAWMHRQSGSAAE